MIKHATNAMLATQISLANELAMIGEAHGVDTQLVAKAMKMDSRIGSKAYVRPGLGFAGGTLPRDLRALQMAGRRDDFVTFMIDSAIQINVNVIEHIAQSAIAMMPKAPRTICIMGYTYKADTDALRKSPVRAARDTDPSHRSRPEPRRERRRLRPALRRQAHRASRWTTTRTGSSDLRILHTCRGTRSNARPIYPAASTCSSSSRRCRSSSSSTGAECAPAIVYDLCDGVDRGDALTAGLSYKAIWQPIESWTTARATHDWAAPTGYVGYLMNQAHHALRRCKRCGVAYTQPLRDPITGVSGPYHVWKGETCDAIVDSLASALAQQSTGPGPTCRRCGKLTNDVRNPTATGPGQRCACARPEVGE